MPRTGLTAIELLIVIVIVAVLTTMTAVGLQRSLRGAAVERAASEIVRAANEARLLAMRELPDEKAVSYGVIIVDDPAQGAPFVAVLRGGPADGKGDDAARIWTDADGKARHKVELPRSVVLWTGESDLRSASTPAVSWWYRPSSGVPVILGAAGFSLAPVGVGLPAVPLDRVWGLDGPAYNGTAPAVAAGPVDEPGLSVRSPDGGQRQAVYVFPSGAIVKRGF